MRHVVAMSRRYRGFGRGGAKKPDGPATLFHDGVPLRKRMLFRLGVVIPFERAGGIFGPSAQAASQLAAAEINDADGILGQEVELEFIDGGKTPTEVAAAVSDLLALGRIDALTGWHVSSLRNRLAPVVGGRVPYVYAPVYEGAETRSGIYCLGETPIEQILPALRILARERGLRRWLVVGDNYVWPRETHHALRRVAPEFGIDIMGAAFFGDESTTDPAAQTRVLDRLPRFACHGVLILKVGQNAVDFNRAFAARGLPRSIARLSPLMEENILMAGGLEATVNLFSTGGYFRTLATAESLEFVGNYTRRFGLGAPPLSAPSESCYDGIFAVKSLVERARGTAVVDTDRAVDGLRLQGPRGIVSFVGNQARQRMYLAEAEGFDFSVIGSWTQR